ncbi:MAG: glycosyltransferase family 2 protein [Lachnospiraceae bacterium]|nr:glycosyltransferase family 2 protein [Lachnospiraceae bacterium]
MISVIVPVYNVEKYLRCCLDSIKEQTYKEIEVIMIDDGSTDHSYEICKEYQEEDERFQVIHQENKGLASARNTGIRAAKGDFLFFVDSDDCINICLLELLYNVAETKGANIVQIGFEDVESNFKDYHKNVDLKNLEKYTHTLSAKDCLYIIERSKPGKEYEINLRTIVVWTKLYRKSAFDSLLFPEGMRLHEDQFVIHRNIIAADGITYIDLPLYYYRKAEGSLIRVGWTPKRLSILECYDDRIKSVQHSELEGKEDLINHIFYRYLVCIFRNYGMADQKLKGEERKKICLLLKEKMKKIYHSKMGKITASKKIFFQYFMLCPTMCVRSCRVIDKIRGRW